MGDGSLPLSPGSASGCCSETSSELLDLGMLWTLGLLLVELLVIGSGTLSGKVRSSGGSLVLFWGFMVGIC